jgi:hypothetical protein
MFGGSALWGTGARDEFTIPSILAKELEQVGIVCDITNFGESGYVSTQEVITLLLRLQKGDVPDLVIFYDGVNDAFSAYQQNSGGLPLNEFRRVSEFNLTQPEEFRRRRGLAVHDAANRLATTSFLHGILRRLGVQENARSETEPIGKPSGPLDASLDQDVVHTYCSNMDLAKTLGDRYGFSSLIYWQPTIFHKGSRTPYEQAEMDRAKATEPFYRTTYELIERHRCGEHRASFHDLSGIFAEVREPVFVDWCHLGETGNEIVAKRIAQDVIPLLSRKHPR